MKIALSIYATIGVMLWVGFMFDRFDQNKEIGWEEFTISPVLFVVLWGPFFLKVWLFKPRRGARERGAK